MALGGGGLDAQIEQRMDAYRGDPQKLQQRYGANKELLDLLALQKLTSEKQAVARDMQMKQQQEPGTIAQQREQEALQLTKQEMGSTLGDLAGRTKGTLDQQQRMQQQNMQRMAKAQPRKPAGIAGLPGLAGGQLKRPQAAPSQAEGLAAARMAQGPKMMAGGGIVSFAEGGRSSASFKDYAGIGVGGIGEATRKRIRELGLTQQQFQALPPEQKKRLLQTLTDRSNAASVGQSLGSIPAELNDAVLDPLKVIGNLGVDFSNSRVGRTLGLSDPMDPNKPYMYDANRKRIQDAARKNQTPVGGLTEADALQFMPDTSQVYPPPGGPAMQPFDPNAVPKPEPDAPAPNLPNQAPPSVSAAPKPDEGGLSSLTVPQTGGAVNPVGPAMSPTNETSADAALRKGMAMSDDYLKRDETSAKYDEMLARMQAFDKENYSEGEDLTAFLIGTGGTGSIGSLVRGGAAAANESRNNRRKRLFDEFAMERNKMGDDAALGMKGLELANQLAADASANERNIRNSITTLTAEQMRQRGKDADRVVTVENNRLAALDAVAKNAIATARNEAINDSTRLSAAMKLSTEIADTRSAMVTAETERSQILQDLEIELADAVSDEAKPEKINAINNNIRAEQQRIREVVELALNSERKDGQNYLELESMANTIMEELMQKGSGRSVEDITNVTVD